MRTLRDLEVTNGGLYDKIIDAQKKESRYDKGDIFSLVITGLLALGILAAAVLLICGKGGRLLAGYNTMTPRGTRGL